MQMPAGIVPGVRVGKAGGGDRGHRVCLLHLRGAAQLSEAGQGHGGMRTQGCQSFRFFK